MLEKLVENWLDSASERSYQAPFCQMLAARGHTIVHSTRHAPTEFGKDIITVDANGNPWAFQLKGNPGGRLTKTQVADIATQLNELVVYAITHPGVPSSKRHKCVLVTNGQIEEEASAAIGAINLSLQKLGHGKDRIQVWTRGTLLKMATELGSNFWPSEVKDMNAMLELLVHPGDDIFPHAKLHQLLQPLLFLSETDSESPSKADLSRRITSAAVLVSVVLRSFALKKNHYAAIVAWTMFYFYSIATVVKHGFKLTGTTKLSVELSKSTICDSLASLCEDVVGNPDLAPSVGSTFAPIHRAMAMLTQGLMSVYWLWSEQVGWEVGAHKEFLSAWLPRDFSKCLLWGEACLPQVLAHHWYISSRDATEASERTLGELVRAVILSCRGGTGSVFPSPYYTFEEVQRHVMRQFLPSAVDVLESETANGTSFYSEGLLHIFVRTNRKETCQILWPELSHLILRDFRPEKPWAFGLAHCERGSEASIVPPTGKRWTELVEDARDCRPGIPQDMAENEFLLLLFLIAFPFRATTQVLRYLDLRLGAVWMIPPAIGLSSR